MAAWTATSMETRRLHLQALSTPDRGPSAKARRRTKPGQDTSTRRRSSIGFCPSCGKTWGVIDGRCEACGGRILEAD